MPLLHCVHQKLIRLLSNNNEQPVPITSLECQWNKLRQQKDSKAKVSDVKFKKHVYGSQVNHTLEPIDTFDPRPDEYKSTATEHLL